MLQQNVNDIIWNGIMDTIFEMPLQYKDATVTIIPRSALSKYKQQERNVGVYLLFPLSNPSVYIGESDNLYSRLRQHISSYNSESARGAERFFWQYSFVFSSPTFTKATSRYLEHHLCGLAKEYGSFEVYTKATQKKCELPAGEKESLDKFMELIRAFCSYVNRSPFEYSSFFSDIHTVPLTCKNNKGADLSLVVSDDGIIVKAGGKIATKNIVIPDSGAESKRKELLKNGSVTEETITKDLIFTNAQVFSPVFLGTFSHSYQLRRQNTIGDER